MVVQNKLDTKRPCVFYNLKETLDKYKVSIAEKLTNQNIEAKEYHALTITMLRHQLQKNNGRLQLHNFNYQDRCIFTQSYWSEQVTFLA